MSVQGGVDREKWTLLSASTVPVDNWDSTPRISSTVLSAVAWQSTIGSRGDRVERGVGNILCPFFTTGITASKFRKFVYIKLNVIYIKSSRGFCTLQKLDAILSRCASLFANNIIALDEVDELSRIVLDFSNIARFRDRLNREKPARVTSPSELIEF